MHLEYAVEKTNEISFDLPPPFLKQRYGKRQTLPKPTAEINIKINFNFQEYEHLSTNQMLIMLKRIQ